MRRRSLFGALAASQVARCAPEPAYVGVAAHQVTPRMTSGITPDDVAAMLERAVEGFRIGSPRTSETFAFVRSEWLAEMARDRPTLLAKMALRTRATQ
jgi:hypothetical protein